MIWGPGPVQVSRIDYTLRGPELGFVIPQGDLAALEDVMRRASSFWNGIGSLIIGVRRDGRLESYIERMLEVRGLDQVLVHQAVGDRAREALAKRFGMIGSMWIDANEIHPYYLSLNDRDEALASIQRPLFTSRRLRRVALATWGEIPDEDLEDWRRRFTVTETDDRAQALRGLLFAQLLGNSPLELGGRHMRLTEQRGGVDGWPCLFVFGEAGFNEILHFWNLRSRLSGAYGRRGIIAVPRELLSAADLEPLRGLAEQPAFGTYFKPDISLASPIKEAPAARAALEELGFASAGERTHYQHASPKPPEGREQLEYFELGTAQLGGSMKRGAKASVLATVTGRRISLDLPSPDGVRLPFGYLRLGIDGLPLPLPLRDAGARRLLPNAWVSREGLTVKTHTEKNWRFEFELPDAEQALADWASSSGYEVRPSQPGRYGQALMARLDDPADLDALADPLAGPILTELTPDSTKKLAQRLSLDVEAGPEGLDEEVLLELLQRQGLLLRVAAKTLHQIASAVGKGKRQVAPALADLVGAGFVRRGIGFPCSRCGFDQVVPLADLDERVECQACRKEMVVPVLSGDSEHPFAYFLDGLTARLMEQDLLSVILALRRALQDSPSPDSFYAWPGLLFEREGKEVDGDLLMSDGSSVQIFECKMTCSRLDLEQTRRLVDLCDALGARPGVAGLRGEFDRTVRELVLDSGGVVYGRAELLAETRR
jgi:hypothetical protein